MTAKVMTTETAKMNTKKCQKDSLRFVILQHQTPAGEHWDMMFETESALTVWSIPPQNCSGAAFVCPAKKLPDHRKDYLDYEGEISGNRGTVSRIDTGTYEEQTPQQFLLHGTLFSGIFLVLTEEMTCRFTNL